MQKFYEDEVYIKMCEKAPEEFKKIWIASCGDCYGCYAEPNKRQIIVFDNNLENINGWKESEDSFPIYRQDQLQEMINWNYKLTHFVGDRTFDIEWAIIKEEGDVLVQAPLNRCLNFPSIERILLLMIIKEKFNKTWDGEWEEWKD